MWKSLLPNEVIEALEFYGRVQCKEILPYYFILNMESIKYVEGLIELEAKEEVTLFQLETYLTTLGIREDIVLEFDFLRKVRNSMAHNLYAVHASNDYLEVFEEYLAILDQIVNDVVSQLNLKTTNTLKSNIFTGDK